MHSEKKITRQKSLVFFALVFFVHRLADSQEVDFVRDVRPIFEKHCYSCHGQQKQKSGLRLDVKDSAFQGGEGYGPSIVAGNIEDSPLIELITSDDEDLRMPPKGKPLSAGEINLLKNWIGKGAQWPDGVDLVQLENRRDHWSFKPWAAVKLPQVKNPEWITNEIDRFILHRLERDGLQPSVPASALTWLRRVTLDLTGIPPSPDEVRDFGQQLRSGEAAFTTVVDRLLNSPRYGERWGQHWLDVVRYADTHGFEVNTERPHAWPYRDYVINAHNSDTPYDQFVREQLFGDGLNADAATGFLVTASVLLPGQIGKDGPSIRLARQDALDEIVNNIGQSFLGLSIGCARCHDHKFDPISSREYYSIQSFVAGVEYGDRKISNPITKETAEKVIAWRQRVNQIERNLQEFVPFAQPQLHSKLKDKVTDATGNIENFNPMEAKFVRLTIYDCNRHPTLGLIEPCIDEFEIFGETSNPENLALASMGTKVTASGSENSANHKLAFVNDGQYGNARSWMSDKPGKGWVMFELPAVKKIRKIIWSRDRVGKFKDRLPIAYKIEAGRTKESMKVIRYVPPLRPGIQPSVNHERFLPVKTKRLRFTISATNSLEPCLDELEVFDLQGRNIALASRGTKVLTSGDKVAADRHEPRFINDGEYGNSRSWMSDAVGKGWIELRFPREAEITRVAWGRDREGNFSDRLAVRYRIEVLSGGEWRVVADESDRRPFESIPARVIAFGSAGLSAEEIQKAEQLADEKQKLEGEINSIRSGQLAFAGKFRKPDEIHLLRRGDPEQPGESVVPETLDVIGKVVLAKTATDQDRRAALANWIVTPNNPLTARVIVNRIWQWHFGMGLVPTANDFGRNGIKPTHPELLDWLAAEFVDKGWSMKQLHRLIVLSSTYRQAGVHNAKAAELDAGVKLLWRFPSRRLEAEAIRDSMLAVSGQLNFTMTGRGFDLFNKRGGLSGFIPLETLSTEGKRRMVYAHKVRRERDAVFGAFDCPDAGQSTARRMVSTTPLQALNLFNSRMTIDLSNAFAGRIRSEVGEDIVDQIHRAYEIALGRQPSKNELADVAPVIKEHGLAMLCRVLFNSNEFLFLP